MALPFIQFYLMEVFEFIIAAISNGHIRFWDEFKCEATTQYLT